MEFVLELLKATIALFIVLDPLGNIPIFLNLTAGMSKQEKRKTFRIACIVTFALLMVFVLIGQKLLDLFGISIGSFMIAGGILLLILAIKILVYGSWEEKDVGSESIGAVPIAFPLLVGPGAITTAIVIIETAGLIIAVLSVLTTITITWLILRHIDLVYYILGKTGSIVVARVMAVFIAAIAVDFIVEGIKLT